MGEERTSPVLRIPLRRDDPVLRRWVLTLLPPPSRAFRAEPPFGAQLEGWERLVIDLHGLEWLEERAQA